MNIPKDQKYRDPFISRPGYKIIAADFSQEELRLMAVVMNISRMIRAFNNGIDLHLATASGLFNVPVEEVTKAQRSRGKTLNFAVGYGSTEYGLYKNFGIPMDEGKELLRKYFEDLYPEYTAFKNVAGKRILEQGWTTTLLGRKRFFEKKVLYTDYREKEREEASIVREGINTIIQGTGADIIKESLVRMFRENPFGEDNFRILIQVYDEIVCEIKEEYAEEGKEFVKRIMEETEAKYLKGAVPAVVDIACEPYWKH